MEENEDELLQMELDTLSEIYQDEFKIITKNQLSIKLPREQQKKSGLIFVVTLSEGYPFVPPENIQIFPYGCNITSATINNFVEILNDEAKEKIGSPMLYSLTETLRSQFNYMDDSMSLGEFSFLPSDCLYHMFTFLDTYCLGILAQICKQFKILADGPMAWKERFINLYPEDKREALFMSKVKNWKEKYIKLSKLENFTEILQPMKRTLPYTYYISVMDRVGTGDYWPSDLDWKTAFKQEIQKRAQVILTDGPNEGQILNSADRSEIGAYCLVSHHTICTSYPYKWCREFITSNIHNCRYIGDTRGWFSFNLQSNPYSENFVKNLALVCRGVFRNTRYDDPFFTSTVVYYPLWCTFDMVKDSKNKIAITHARINRNTTPNAIQTLVPLHTQTPYWKHLQNNLLKLPISNNKKNNNNLTPIWCWVISTALAKYIDKPTGLLEQEKCFEKLKFEGTLTESIPHRNLWLCLMFKPKKREY